MNPDKKTYHFAQANPKGSENTAPALLRRVAKTLDNLKGAVVKDMVLNEAKADADKMNLAVYYTYPEKTVPDSSDELYEMDCITIAIERTEDKSDFLSLLTKAQEELTALGKIEVFNVSLDNIVGSDGDKYALTVYYSKD